jgi:hypothetical protein
MNFFKILCPVLWTNVTQKGQASPFFLIDLLNITYARRDTQRKMKVFVREYLCV